MIAKRIFALAAALLAHAPSAWAAGDNIDAVIERERQNYALSCKDIEFMPEALWSGDINKDGLTDAVVRSSAIACDKEFGVECDPLGCPIRIYVQSDDGRFAYVGQVRALGYEIRYRYGIRIMDFHITGNKCQKLNTTECSLIARVEGNKLITLSTE